MYLFLLVSLFEKYAFKKTRALKDSDPKLHLNFVAFSECVNFKFYVLDRSEMVPGTVHWMNLHYFITQLTLVITEQTL